jgi:hypothetical protein
MYNIIIRIINYIVAGGGRVMHIRPSFPNYTGGAFLTFRFSPLSYILHRGCSFIVRAVLLLWRRCGLTRVVTTELERQTTRNKLLRKRLSILFNILVYRCYIYIEKETSVYVCVLKYVKEREEKRS